MSTWTLENIEKYVKAFQESLSNSILTTKTEYINIDYSKKKTVHFQQNEDEEEEENGDEDLGEINEMEIEEEEEENVNKTLIKKSESKLIPIKDRLTSRFLTKYEKAKVIGERAIQISNGEEVYIDIPEGIWDPLLIAEIELKQRKIPFIIRRYLPDGEFEDWDINELIFD